MTKIVLELSEGAAMFLADTIERREKELHKLTGRMEAAGLDTQHEDRKIELLWSVRGVLIDQIFE